MFFSNILLEFLKKKSVLHCFLLPLEIKKQTSSYPVNTLDGKKPLLVDLRESFAVEFWLWLWHSYKLYLIFTIGSQLFDTSSGKVSWNRIWSWIPGQRQNFLCASGRWSEVINDRNSSSSLTSICKLLQVVAAAFVCICNRSKKTRR